MKLNLLAETQHELIFVGEVPDDIAKKLPKRIKATIKLDNSKTLLIESAVIYV
jgi:hypothetical protein